MILRRESAALLALLLASCDTPKTALEVSRDHLQHGNVPLAFHALKAARDDQLLRKGSVDPELEAEYQALRFRNDLEEARQLIFEDHELRALLLLAEVKERVPHESEVDDLMDRAHHKLALRAAQSGFTHLAKGELDKALLDFDESHRHEPDNKKANEGIAAVHAAVQRLHGEAQDQFLQAIRKLPELRFGEADWHATVSVIRDPTRNDAEEVRLRALRALALTERERAERSQKKGIYGGALLGYREAQHLWPEMPGIDDCVTTMEREVQAQWKVERAAFLIHSDKLDEASQLLKEAFELSTLERGDINVKQYEVRQRLATHAYEHARDLELQGKKEDALAEYERIAADWPNGLKDVKTRVSALRSDIQAAEKAYAEGEAAEQKNDLDAALEHYRAAQTYYAGYKDVAARVVRVQAAISARSGK